MQIPYKYKAFISYSHQDKAFAIWLQKGIENYVIPKTLQEKYPHLPKDLKRSVFRDDDELSSTSVLSTALENALDESERLIVVCSPHAVASLWVEKEIAYFKESHDEEHIYSVIKSGEASDVLPTSLGLEPLAVNAQQGKKMALMKIIATVLDVPFSDLWEREKREAKKRAFVRVGLGLLFVGVVTYSVLQYKAISSNSELESIYTKMSSIEYTLKRKKHATKDVYALQNRLDELKELKKRKIDTLKWFGLLKTSVAKKAKRVYDTQGVDGALAILESEKSRVEDEAYAKKNMLRAKLYIEKNDYPQATYFYEKAVAVDDSYENVYDYVLFLMKENETQKAQVLLEKLNSYDLGMEQKANVLNRLGINYRKLKRLDEAEACYMEALSIRESLAKENPDKYRLDLAWTYNNLGVLYKKANDLNASQKLHYKAFELRKELAKDNPKKYAFYVTCSMHNLGELYSGMKASKRAETFFKDAIKIRRTLIVSNPKKYMPALASTLHELATLYVHTQRLEESKKLYDEALELRRTLAKDNPQAYGEDLLKTRKALEQIVNSGVR
jgi:tetratricopeptide (TPR) repeat protein